MPIDDNSSDDAEFGAAFPKDPKIDEAKAQLTELFGADRELVLYHRQAAIFLEKPFFHWITGRALRLLVDEGVLRGEQLEIKGLFGRPPRFYSSPRNRYWTRKAKNMGTVMARFASPSFIKAIGQHGEMLVDATLPRARFIRVARDVKEWNGRSWTQTGHDLDRIFERNGIYYGVEIKNTLDYMPKDELDAKIAMCRHLQLVPLFVVRMAPASYMHQVQQAGGVTLVLKYQLYPFAEEAFAKVVQDQLKLPVDCPRELSDGTLQRLDRALANAALRR